MSPISVDPAGTEPPYEQVRRQIAADVASGELASGRKLPTVRQLAADLGLAANTVARAYRLLEADGVVVTQGRRGTFVRSAVLDPTTLSGPGGSAAAAESRRAVHEAASAYAALARREGLSLDEALRLVEDDWTRR